MTLYWLYNHQKLFDTEIKYCIEKVITDFEYPKDAENLIYYTPYNPKGLPKGEFPYEAWRNYLCGKKKKYHSKAFHLVEAE